MKKQPIINKYFTTLKILLQRFYLESTFFAQFPPLKIIFSLHSAQNLHHLPAGFLCRLILIKLLNFQTSWRTLTDASIYHQRF